MTKLFPLLLIISIYLVSCSEKNIIEEEKFVLVYSDLLVAGDTTSIKTAKKVVFEKYQVKNQEYENTLQYYNSNPEMWDAFFEKVITHIEGLKQNSSSEL